MKGFVRRTGSVEQNGVMDSDGVVVSDTASPTIIVIPINQGEIIRSVSIESFDAACKALARFAQGERGGNFQSSVEIISEGSLGNHESHHQLNPFRDNPVRTGYVRASFWWLNVGDTFRCQVGVETSG